jgi:hypothetical protein
MSQAYCTNSWAVGSRIGEIAWQSLLNQADVFFRNEGMGSVSPKEDDVFLFAVAAMY